MKLLQLINHKAKLPGFNPKCKGQKSITTSFKTLPGSAATSSGKEQTHMSL